MGVSRRSAEGMANQKVDAGVSKADWPAYDRNVPPMFG
jgi:hypothetical protein